MQKSDARRPFAPLRLISIVLPSRLYFAPRAQSVSYNGILYTSGITTTDLDADITGQTQDVIHIIDNILARNGIDKTRVLTAAITLADMADYGAFNAVWDAWVVDGYEPARSVTGGQLAVPEYKIKISVTAAL